MAENLLNPFGDDDNDIDINYLIDRNLQVKNIHDQFDFTKTLDDLFVCFYNSMYLYVNIC